MLRLTILERDGGGYGSPLKGQGSTATWIAASDLAGSASAGGAERHIGTASRVVLLARCNLVNHVHEQATNFDVDREPWRTRRPLRSPA